MNPDPTIGKTPAKTPPGKGSSKRSTILGFVLLVGAALVGARFYLASRAEKPAEPPRAQAADANAEPIIDLNEKQVGAIKIGTVGEQDFNQDVRAVGAVDFNQNMVVQVFTPYQGRIINAYPNAGDKITKDQVLFTIDSPDLLQAESTLIAADGVMQLQSHTLNRVKALLKIGGVSQQAVDQTTSDQQTAEGAVRSARDAVRIFGKTDDDIDKIVASRKADPRLVVKSPINGFVTARTASPGLFVQPGTAPPPYIVADTSIMWLIANVVEEDAPKLKVGQQVAAQVGAYPDRTFDGIVTVVGPSIDPNTRRVFVRSEIKDPEHLLRAGMFANFVIRVANPIHSAAVPAAAVVREGDGTMTAWTTKDKKRFRQQTIKTGLTQNGFVQIESGLDPGETVVTEGAIFLSNKLSGGATD